MVKGKLLTATSVITIGVIFILPYLLKLGSFTLSSEHSDWGAFGEYFNLFVGIINLVILYEISDTANKIHKGSVNKQLKADVYKDFLQRIDNHSENMIVCLLSESDITSAAHLMLTTVENGKTDFSILLGAIHQDFNLQCDELISATKAIRDNKTSTETQNLINTFLNKKSEVRKYLYTQISGFTL